MATGGNGENLALVVEHAMKVSVKGDVSATIHPPKMVESRAPRDKMCGGVCV